MQKGKVRFRRPTADEQTVLSDMGVKLLVRPQDIQKCDQLLIEHHYLHSAQLVGEQLRYAVTWKWQFSTGDEIDGSAAIAADGTVYFGSADRKVYALSSAGSKLWEFATGSINLASPAIGPDGSVYIGSTGNNFYALAGTANVASSPWPMFHRDQRHTGAAPQQTVVHLANPAGAPVFTTGDPITLVVDATAAVAPILEVRFYAGTNWLGSATNSPYVLAWTNALPGDIALTDAATDFSGSNGTSAPVFITVVAPSTNFPVQLLAQGAGSFTLVPQAGAYAPGTPVTVTARAGRYYAFVQWSDGDTNNPRTIVVGTSNTFTAVFTNLVPLETRVLRQWDQSYGGPGVNSLSAILPTADGGFLLGCSSGAGSGNNKTSGNFGGSDYWVVKVDGSGNPLWDLVYGGTNDDTLTAIQPTSDGGYLLGGSSASGVSGNKTTLNFGGLDFWIVKIDGNGVKQWDKVYGGVADDVLAAMAPTGDGGFLLGGTTQSDISGNKTTPIYGGQDFWVIKN